ncbi:antitoxin [Euzebya sp.]|uniref:antitoxin n=1 Tax=Euzebya sp. TaxID=1971409 RepID=UPI0035116863
MRRRGVTFKEAVNSAIRAGLTRSPSPAEPFRTRAVPMGTPAVNLDRALQIAGELEDEELIRRMRVGK